MPLDEFSIDFDNPTKSFNPGQSVSGRVIVSAPVETRTQGLQIKCSGQATVSWMESMDSVAGRGRGTSTIPQVLFFQAAESYFEFEKFLVGDGKGDGIRIPPGRNEYPFNFQLPKGLPHSYVGSLGKITYEIVATIKRSWKFDKELKESLNVVTIVDLSRYPSSAEPVVRKKETKLCCCCCESGPVGFEITLPKGGFLPGEIISPEVRVFNESGRGISGINVCLVQKSIFNAMKRLKPVSKTLHELDGPSVDPRDTHVWKPDLQVPEDLLPTKLGGGCGIMDLQYYVHCYMTVPTGTLANNLKEEIPVIIGNV